VEGNRRLGTVLGVWAHPDDETYLSAGLMAEAAAAGSRVVCVTATRGELGSTDGEKWPPGPGLAAVRTVELESALRELGDIEHHWLDYPDGGCADVPDDEAVARIEKILIDVRPDTVLTFGPDGMTGHQDHISACRWTTAAFGATAPDGAVLGYATNTPARLARYRPRLDALGVFMDAEPPSTPESEVLIRAVFTGDVLEAKMRAIRAQTSQVEGLMSALGEDFVRGWMAEEAFRAP
jgi:LmbE family N-acetylglucosaminyl deacetylase